jgi:hypothetical protein
MVQKQKKRRRRGRGRGRGRGKGRKEKEKSWESFLCVFARCAIVYCVVTQLKQKQREAAS